MWTWPAKIFSPIAKWLGLQLIQQLISFFSKKLADYLEKRKRAKETKEQIEAVKEAQTTEEKQDALNDIACNFPT